MNQEPDEEISGWALGLSPATELEALITLAAFAREAPGRLPERIRVAPEIADRAKRDRCIIFADPAEQPCLAK
jgi:hypothetical protein